MRDYMNKVSGFALFIVFEIIASVIVLVFINPVLDRESIWSDIVLGIIIFLNVFIFLVVIFVYYYKEVKSGVATSIIVKICAVFLVIFIVGTTIVLFIYQT